MIRLPDPLRFEWDDGNRDKNWLKHGVSASEAEEVFFELHKKLANDMIHTTEREKRFILLGKTRLERLLFIVITIRENDVRVISARDVNGKEKPLLRLPPADPSW